MIKLNNITLFCDPKKMEFQDKVFDHIHILDVNNKEIFPNSFYFRKLIKVHPSNEVVGSFTINNLYMAYSNSWVSNYQHLICDFYPFLYYYKMNSIDAYLGIPECIKSKPIDELIDLIQINKKKIIWLRNNVTYKIKNYFTYKYGKTLSDNDFDFNWYIKPLCYLNNLLNDRNNILNTDNKGILYVSRDDIVTTNNNNNFAGKARDIINKDQLYDYLNINKIDAKHMSQYKIIEKNRILSQYDSFITLYGANIINLVFAKNIKNVLILGNNRNSSCLGYYKKVLEKIFNHEVRMQIVTDKKANLYFNQPYIINIKDIHNITLLWNDKLIIKDNHLNNDIITKYESDEKFLMELLFDKLLHREPSKQEVNFHLINIQKNGRDKVFYEFIGCYEYHLNNTHDFMADLLKSKGCL